MKTITKNEKQELENLRKHLVAEIDGAWANLQSSLEQIRRTHYYKLGELFIQLRMTFGKGKNGDDEFVRFFKNRFPRIHESQRREYMHYRKKLGEVKPSLSAESHLPPLRRVTAPQHYKYDNDRPRDKYRRIVDDEVEEPTRFEVERKAKDDEGDLVVELAGKIISAGFRVLSVKLHPDKDGGSNDAMRRLNQAKKLLEDALTRASVRFVLS